jgi:hypothetical protein
MNGFVCLFVCWGGMCIRVCVCVGGRGLVISVLRVVLSPYQPPTQHKDTHGRTHTQSSTCLLRLEPEAGEPPQVFLAHRLVHRGAALDALAVVVRVVRPPVWVVLVVFLCVCVCFFGGGWLGGLGGWAFLLVVEWMVVWLVGGGMDRW